ncbi:uracil-DNA glycosylase family protein [Pseudomonas sp. LS44]|uniref:uracil-DNA glycosylase family protein n=1 Tax=Pseudomonas sp. LS44 TaxID=1357074 RepID=UPI00215B72B1|nr:uracil-DNA glycosylase family protein [Pseudomonas sp. LS44]UVE16874.1 uracil-DNA glycosylase family protein [Pseudomonas sp. LS44]
MTEQDEFEAAISDLTPPLNGQFPRPWMTDLTDPQKANVLIVGKNQAKGYSTENVTHERHINALFNRENESCRRLYDELTGHSPSPTRLNTNMFRSILAQAGIDRVLETNVVCYSTPMSSHLCLPRHSGGTLRGTEIFRTLLHFVKPKVIIAHGSGTRDALSALVGKPLLAPPSSLSPPQSTEVSGIRVFVIPSLAPPQWNKWSRWAEAYLAKVAEAAASAL